MQRRLEDDTILIELYFCLNSTHLESARRYPDVLQAVLWVGADSSGFNNRGFPCRNDGRCIDLY